MSHILNITLCDVELQSLLCCIGVRSPRDMIGSCSVMQSAATKKLNLSQFLPQQDHKGSHCSMVHLDRSTRFGMNLALNLSFPGIIQIKV